MRPTSASFVDLVPQALLLAGALACLFLDRVPTAAARLARTVAGVSIAAFAVAELLLLRGMPGGGWFAFADGLVVDRFTVFTAQVLALLSLAAVIVDQTSPARRPANQGVHAAALLTALIGASLLVAAREMAALFVALELLTVSLLVVVALAKTRPRALAAAARSLGAAAVAVGAVLVGLVLLYGVGGSTDLYAVGRQVTHVSPASALAAALVLGGLLAAAGAVPLDLATRGVSAAASPAASVLVSLVGATAAIAAAARFAVTALPFEVSNWTALVAVAASLSMVGGALATWTARDLRTLAAALVTGQAGLALAGLCAFRRDQQGIGGTLFVLLTSGLALVAVIGVAAALEAAGAPATLAGVRALARRSPVAAVALVVALASLAGAPPLAGFFARVFLLEAVIGAGWAWLAVVALLSTALAAVGSLRWVTEALAAGDEAERPERLALHPAGATLLAVAGGSAIAFAAAAQPLLALALGGGGQIG